MTIVKLIPKSQRIINRISRHGNLMKLIGCYPGKIHIESISNWNDRYYQEWYTEQECDWKVISSEDLTND